MQNLIYKNINKNEKYMNISDELINDNIFNRAIFKKTSIDEINSCLLYYADNEEYEKCMVLKELLNNNYYVEDPEKDELLIITNILENSKDQISEINEIVDEIKNELNLNNKNDIKEILNEIDDITDEIIYNFLEVDELREKFLKQIYENSINCDTPDIKNEKTLNLLKKYRTDSINNIKIILEKFKI